MTGPCPVIAVQTPPRDPQSRGERSDLPKGRGAPLTVGGRRLAREAPAAVEDGGC